ncbi:DUF3576 domain-containing protein [Pseudaestuariivita atlantica]|uniref:Lipoprotein n=1 Tax=Pseudaestuariivita atlantica TaxID=1317121 RepID=A0A0L1JQ43_9RHOB|nr:DUF3576 domain-containing protein [Pseudaestuariivita atlantica]KNG93508.1 hypothetical protein ATO11_09815 [Pseudaestuariivita atlantica]
MKRAVRTTLLCGAGLAVLAACGPNFAERTKSAEELRDEVLYEDRRRPSSRLRDILFNRTDPAKIGAVNKYLWNASLEVLSFLPVQSVDPFTGVIVTGYGTPPGGGRAYRATILVSDPALDARSLSVALQTRSGPVSAATLRAVEDAIMTRARQLRDRDSGF